MINDNPIELINNWLTQEAKLGSSEKRMILSSVDSNNCPHSRVVAFREINDDGVSFGCSNLSAKYQQLLDNPNVAIVIWLPMLQRQVRMRGTAVLLSAAAIKQRWQTAARDMQLLYTVAHAMSGERIHSKQVLMKQHQALSEKLKDQPIPVSKNYAAFQITPNWIEFYALDPEQGFPDVSHYEKRDTGWESTLVAP